MCGHREQLINFLQQGPSEDSPGFPSCRFVETIPRKPTNDEGVLPLPLVLERLKPALMTFCCSSCNCKRIIHICVITSVVIIVENKDIQQEVRKLMCFQNFPCTFFFFLN